MDIVSKYFALVAAVMLALFAGGCSKNTVTEETEVSVKFFLETPEISTAAITGGKSANQVRCIVYRDGSLVERDDVTKIVPMNDGNATYETRLVSGKSYKIVFWAEVKDNTHYSFDYQNAGMTVSYDGACNDESRDAFYKVVDLTVTGAIESQHVTLKRPFAQLNYGLSAADKALVDAAGGGGIRNSTVKIDDGAYTKMNLLTGDVAGAQSVTFSAAELPKEPLNVRADGASATTAYTHLAMNYILVDRDVIPNATLTLYDWSDAVVAIVPVSQVPLQRNYRTNIVGDLISAPAALNIVVDPYFVLSKLEAASASMLGVYESWRRACNSYVFGSGLYYALDIAGSDIERHPEVFSNRPINHWMECLYQNGKYTSEYEIFSMNERAYNMLFEVVGKSNVVIGAIESMSDYDSMISSASPSDLGQLYGEAICARAVAYRELIKYYGDVPFAAKTGDVVGGLAPRDSIYDCIIADLDKVIPLMKTVGIVEKNKFSKTFAQGLAGRLCLEAGGYQTRRADLGADFYKGADGKVLTFETKGQANANADNAVYGRRSDWKTFYEKAAKYYKDVIANSGSAVWHDTDPRKNEEKRVYNNPYQYFFQQLNNREYADESIYEYDMAIGSSNERPYSSGRPSNGLTSWAFPCKSYGQARINPAYYYGVFDPKDMRRDVSVTATGSDGKGAEILIPFVPNSKAFGGGLSMNKFDENRMSKPYIVKLRQSGINGPYMRLAEIYLGYAEVCAALGDESTAMEYLKKVRERSFPAGEANTDAFVAKCGSVLRAVIEERGFEYAGEGDRRWTLIRSGYLPEAIKNIKDMTAAMIEGLKANGSYTFENGNTISSEVWVKTVDAKSKYGFRLTAQCTDESDPVLFPGWRGQNDDWAAVAEWTAWNYGAPSGKIPTAGDNTNLAIEGLFKPVADAAALEADGYARKDWGSDLVKYEKEYLDYLFYDYDYVSAPIYLVPFTPNVLSTGGFTNGYGFRQQ